MSLQSWIQNSWLVQHPTSADEVRKLLAISDRDLVACPLKQLPADRRCAIAYNAALQAATSALTAAGYRATRDNHHYRVMQSLEFTIAPGRKFNDTLDGFRKKRNLSSYDVAGAVSDKEQMRCLSLRGVSAPRHFAPPLCPTHSQKARMSGPSSENWELRTENRFYTSASSSSSNCLL
jgi:hypothetical protein